MKKNNKEPKPNFEFSWGILIFVGVVIVAMIVLIILIRNM